jgi:hypothetical protein
MRQIIKKIVERKNRGKTKLDETDGKQKCGEERQIVNKSVERRDRWKTRGCRLADGKG